MQRKEGLDKLLIRESDSDDIPSIVNAFSFYLEEIQNNQKQDLTFDDYNVKLFRVLLRQSMEEFGIKPLIALIDGRKVGFNFWIKVQGFNLKFEMVNALGTYIEPEFRGIGIASKLTNQNFEILKAKGIQKIYGKLINPNEEFQKSLGFETETILCKNL